MAAAHVCPRKRLQGRYCMEAIDSERLHSSRRRPDGRFRPIRWTHGTRGSDGGHGTRWMFQGSFVYFFGAPICLRGEIMGLVVCRTSCDTRAVIPSFDALNVHDISVCLSW